MDKIDYQVEMEVVMFRCFQDGKRCVDYKIGDWNKDTFDTFEEAEAFCAHWANKERVVFGYCPIDLNTPIDMSITDFPIMMEIRAVE